MKTIEIKLQKGDQATKPELHIVPGHSPAGTYLWIGDDDNGCYATYGGVKRLEGLAMKILKGIGHKVTLS